MSNEDYNSLCRLECEMSWLFYVAGCMLSSIMSYGDNKAQDMEYEATMCAKIFQLTDSINARLDASVTNNSLKIFLFFFSCIGERSRAFITLYICTKELSYLP